MKNNTTLSLGEKIRQIRKSKQLTQAYLAHALNCSEMHISRIERGDVECNVQTIAAIKKALEISNAPLTEYELAVYNSQIWVWHEQLVARRIDDAKVMKDELVSILHLPFEKELIIIYLMLEVWLSLALFVRPPLKTNDNDVIAIEHKLDMAKTLLDELDDTSSVEARYLYHRNKGTLFAYGHDYKNVLEHYLEAIRFINSSSVLKPDSMLYWGIAQTYLNLGRPHYVLLYTERALLIDSNDPTSINRPAIIMAQAACKTFLGELDEAKALYGESLARAQSVNNKTAIGIAIVDLGDIELRMGYPKKALELLNRAEAHFEDGLDVLSRSLFLYIKTKCLLKLKLNDECEKVIEEGIALAQQAESKGYLICFETSRHLMSLKSLESQEYLENVAIPYFRNSNSILIYEAQEICHTLEAFYKKSRSKVKALTIASVSRDILHEMFYGTALTL
ncbi:MAG: helix-turn-helix transcriptional regulator [Defluviitaleaceae bacterium]|nr:helix-turn-helix transcriptional regulator [Defluviitaleaceae bacterium]